ncbi:hypothetical protein BTJ40_05035 [Microbulbifer sp. A4B17]|uniref:hypothetical protein n=1 Tax=Microbulbifer sp. A4B17 TaxID=359370 RepID=UPI000D52BA3D|nr:hypothetical protein [Microbulbifer sp. A4B17]AWF80224.1 hypothetical protein BTJ40_05035 [Microbulbifer sp. A4B17]
MNKVVYLLLILSPLAQACELTKEYREARNQMVKDSQYAYEACTSSVNTFHYWQEVAQCEKEGHGKNVGGGCQHIVANRVSPVERNYDHCQGFKLSNEEVKKYVEEYVKSKNITKCSTSQPSSTG